MKQLSFLFLFVLLSGCSMFQQQNEKYPLEVITQSSPSGLIKVLVYGADDTKQTSGVVHVKTENGRLITEGKLEDGAVQFFYPMDENRISILVTSENEGKGRKILTFGQAFPGRKSDNNFRFK